MTLQNKRLIGIMFAVALILSIPLIAMQFTNEVDWDYRDFTVMGILLLSTGLGFELIMRKVKRPENKLVIIVAILALLFLIWAELAVGIFGSPFAGS